MGESANVFISHVHQDEAELGAMKDLLANGGFSVRDSSINSSRPNEAENPEYIKSEILAPAIRWAGTCIVLVSPGTHDNSWVDWEIEYAHKLGKRIVGVWARGAKASDVPAALNEYADAVVGWQADSIIDAIRGRINDRHNGETIHPFEAETADELWQSVAWQFRSGHTLRIQAGRGGRTLELPHAIFSIADSRQRWIPSRQPSMNPAFAVAELVWMIRGRNDSEFLNHWNPVLPKFAGHDNTYHGAYGYRLRRHFSVDQVERAYQALQHNPQTRQVVLQIWDSTVDLPDPDGCPAAEDIPCSVCAILKIRGHRLEWTQVMRSNDFVLGFPYNVAQFTAMQEIMAGWLGLELGTYTHLSDSLHVYERDVEHLMKPQPIIPTRNVDSLDLPKAQSDQIFAELERRMERMAASKLTRKDIESLARFEEAPIGYRNLLRVVAADDARRRELPDLAESIMEGSTNPALSQLWEHWARRKARV